MKIWNTIMIFNGKNRLELITKGGSFPFGIRNIFTIV